MNRTVLVPVADGTEEIEAVTIIDTLRRAGCTVTVAAAGGDRQVTCSRGVRLVADTLLEELGDRTFDLIALPGGQRGAEHLQGRDDLIVRLRAHMAEGGLVGAICAAPAVVLAAHGLLAGRRVTSHPSVMAALPTEGRMDARVVVDGTLVTSQGPGTALEFALTLVAMLLGPDARDAVAEPMLAAI